MSERNMIPLYGFAFSGDLQVLHTLQVLKPRANTRTYPKVSGLSR